MAPEIDVTLIVVEGEPVPVAVKVAVLNVRFKAKKSSDQLSAAQLLVLVMADTFMLLVRLVPIGVSDALNTTG